MKIFYYITRNFKIQFNDFIETTSIPGYKFTNCNDKKSQQFLWHAILNFNLLTIIAVGLKFWNQYENQAILSVYEVIEQGTKLPFPAVYLCLGYPLNPRRLATYRHKMLKSNNLSISATDFDKGLQNALRFQRSAFRVSYDMQAISDNIDDKKVLKYLPKIYYHVSEMLKDCYLQGEHIECDELFKPQNTLPGYCFVFNSIYSTENLHDNPNRVTFKQLSEFDMDWSLNFTISTKDDIPILIYLKDPRNLLSLQDFPNYIWNSFKKIFKYEYTIVQHYCENNIKELKISQRKCLFNDESFFFEELRKEFKSSFYNQDICLTYCQGKEVLKRCQCLPFLEEKLFPILANKYRWCNSSDLQCYEKNYLSIRQYECVECFKNCNYTEYISKPVDISYKYDSSHKSVQKDFQKVSIDLEYWPVLRFRSLIIFTTTEYLLSLISIANLCLGTSFVTVVEALYCLFIRYSCSYCVNRNYLQQQFKKQDEMKRLKPIPCIDMSLRPRFRK